jgi:hypothetical protein
LIFKKQFPTSAVHITQQKLKVSLTASFQESKVRPKKIREKTAEADWLPKFWWDFFSSGPKKKGQSEVQNSSGRFLRDFLGVFVVILCSGN